MSKPSMQNIPGIGAMADTLDFVKNLWGGMSIPGMNIPGMVMPTLSVEEINKQIADLKAVESWLTLNMNMLRSTIQGLEVQSATISTLQSMSETLSAAVAPLQTAKESAAPTSPVFSGSSEKTRKAEPENPSSEASGKPDPSSHPHTAAKSGADAGAAPLANAALWWNMLQDQFKQAVDTALASETPVASATVSKDKPSPVKTAAKKESPLRQRKTPKSAVK